VPARGQVEAARDSKGLDVGVRVALRFACGHAPHPIPPPRGGEGSAFARKRRARSAWAGTATDQGTVQWTVARSLARRRKPEGKGSAAWTVGPEIGTRLPGLARKRACQGQAGAARFVDGQIGQERWTGFLWLDERGFHTPRPPRDIWGGKRTTDGRSASEGSVHFGRRALHGIAEVPALPVVIDFNRASHYSPGEVRARRVVVTLQ
jgi:hypothetical protein